MIEIINYKALNKNSLIGTFSIRVPKWGGFVIQDMAHFQMENKKWITFPSKPYEVDGKKKYMPYNKFEDMKIMEAFQAQVFKSLEEYFKKDSKNEDQEGLPF